jgi:hypothetical protein
MIRSNRGMGTGNFGPGMEASVRCPLPMEMMARWLPAAAALLFLGAAGCVSQETHDQTLAEVRRVRAEAYQRSMEAAALRQMLDRVTVELRTREPVNMELMRRYDELALQFSRLSKQCVDMGDRVQHTAVPILTVSPPPPQSPRGPQVPAGRRIDDDLFGDRR